MPFFFSGADESRPRRFFAFPDWPQTGSPFLLYLFEVFCIFLINQQFLSIFIRFLYAICLDLFVKMLYFLTCKSRCSVWAADVQRSFAKQNNREKGPYNYA